MEKSYIFQIVCWCLAFVISLATCIVHHSWSAGVTAALALVNVAVRVYRLWQDRGNDAPPKA